MPATRSPQSRRRGSRASGIRYGRARILISHCSTVIQSLIDSTQLRSDHEQQESAAILLVPKSPTDNLANTTNCRWDLPIADCQLLVDRLRYLVMLGRMFRVLRRSQADSLQ